MGLDPRIFVVVAACMFGVACSGEGGTAESAEQLASGSFAPGDRLVLTLETTASEDSTVVGEAQLSVGDADAPLRLAVLGHPMRLYHGSAGTEVHFVSEPLTDAQIAGMQSLSRPDQITPTMRLLIGNGHIARDPLGLGKIKAARWRETADGADIRFVYDLGARLAIVEG